MIPQLQAGQSERKDHASLGHSTAACWENIPIQRRGVRYRQGACPYAFHPPVVFCAPDTKQLIQVTGLCHGLVCSVCRNSWIFLQACASAEHHGEDSDPSQHSQVQENLAAVCTEELQHTLSKPHCSSRLIQKGFGLSLLLHTIWENVWSCNVHWNKG